MTRAILYVLAAAGIWMAEGFLFGHFLGFSAWQVALMVVMYSGLFVTAVLLLRRFAATAASAANPLPLWKYLSLAPMVVVVLGSFVSLPVLVLITAIGKWV